ncbi:protein shisa-5 [Tachysurus vachellii]|uniref:protein shisa-5 n=1 Tax=Tachysurus vachellii TaxID=175792 RepID=UPI00296B1952|nr:protein shisa-5 [Tachysurus vachellii]
MSSTISIVLAFTATLLFTAVADDCDSYYTAAGIYKKSQDCKPWQFCCGTCDNRYCCPDPFSKLTLDCDFMEYSNTIPLAAGIASMIIFIILIIACCVCPCCCLYQMCRKPRPVMATTTTTIVNTQYPQQQPPNPATQYPAYQPVPAQPGYSAQPGYGGQAMPAAPYQGQPYVPGPPPPYQESGGYPAPYSQAAFDGSHAPYPLNPLGQPSFPHPPPTTDYNAAQPPFNPAYLEQPKTGY